MMSKDTYRVRELLADFHERACVEQHAQAEYVYWLWKAVFDAVRKAHK